MSKKVARASKVKQPEKTASVDDFLSKFTGGVDEHIDVEKSLLAAAREVVSKHENNLRRLELIKKVGQGQINFAAAARESTKRAPRSVGAEIKAKVKTFLADGEKPIAAIIKELGLPGQQVRNQVAQMSTTTKNRPAVLINKGGVYSLKP
jgi:hypothetical protein